MDKRVTGVTVIVAGLLAIVVLSGLQGRLTAGVARHGPSVRTGDCAQLSPPPSPGNSSDIRRSPVPVAAWAACSESGAGTVIGTSSRAQLPESETPIGYQDLQGECRTPLQNYLFGLVGSDYSWDVTGSHLTFRPMTGVLALPARAAADGAPGVCVLARSSADDTWQPVAVDPLRPGDAIGVCAPGWQDRRFVACDRPHQVEVLALVTDRRVRMGVNLRGRDGCAAFAALVTGREDPTFGGQLEILMDPITGDDSDQVMCALGVIDPARRLGRSLIGIEDATVPWA